MSQVKRFVAGLVFLTGSGPSDPDRAGMAMDLR